MRPARRGRVLPHVLPRLSVQGGLRRRVRHGAARRDRGDVRVLRRRPRLPLLPRCPWRRPLVQARVPRAFADVSALRGRRRRARGHGGVPARAHRARDGPHRRLPAHRDGAFELRELPDAHRHEGRARVPGSPVARGGVRPAPGAGSRRRRMGEPRRRRGRLRVHLQRAGGQALRPSRVGHARPLVGDVVSRRAGGLPRLRPGVSEQLRSARGHLRRGAGHQKRHRGGARDARARRAPGGHPHRLR